MKILIATPLYPPDIGGPATYAKTLKEELPKRGHEVQIVSYHAVRHLPKVLAYPLYGLKILFAARDCDLLLALDPVHTGMSAWFAASMWNKPYVLKIVGDYAWEQGNQRFGVKENLDEFEKLPPNRMLFQVRLLRFVERFVALRARQVIVPSEYLKRIVSLWGISAEKITVIYNAFEHKEELPDRAAIRAKLGLSGTVLLSAGRLVPWKGFGTLIALMGELRKTTPDAKLFIAGSGPLEGELKRKVVEFHAADAVVLLGDVPHAQLMEHISAADCFVLNSGYEGLSHLLLEVLAMGTPIVTTDVGGNPELIEHEKTGLLVSFDKREELLGAIKRVLDNKTEAQRCAKNGKEFVSSFNVERMVEETIALLRKAIERP